jgi:hypothetical protein
MSVRDRLVRLLSRDPLFALALTLIAAASLVPIWSPAVLPMAGWPEELARAADWQRLSTPSFHLAQFYRATVAAVPGWVHLGLLRLLSRVVPYDAAGRLVLSAAVLGLPLGLSVLARRLGRSPWLALFAAPLAWNALVGRGDLGFAVGVALLPWALVAVEQFLDRPTPLGALVLGGAGVMMWLADASAWSCFAGGGAVFALARIGRARPATIAAALLAIGASTLLAVRAVPGPAGDAASPPLVVFLGEAAHVVSMGWAGDRAWWLLLALLVVWGAVLLGSRVDHHDTEAARDGWPFRLEVVVLSAFGLALVLPPALHRPAIEDAPLRFVVLAVTLGTLLPHGPLAGHRRFLAVPLVAIAVMFPLELGSAFRAAEPRLVRPLRLAARIERGASTLTLVLDRDPDPALDPRMRPFDGAHAWPQLYAGGFDAYGPTGFPLTPRPDAILPAPPRDQARLVDLATVAARWDYVLIEGGGNPGALLGPDAARQFAFVAADGPWQLYRSRR